VLGHTGRNFGAGMSGGIAYVYPTGNFDRKVNYEMVEVEQLDEDDRRLLREMIERHLAYTDSAVAKGMLASWSVEVSGFGKVMPVDYKGVLTVMKDAQRQNRASDENVARIMEAARG